MSSRRSPWLPAAIVRAAASVWVAVGLCAQDPQDPPEPFRPFDQAAFEAHAKELGASDARIEAFRAQARETSPGVASDALLRELSLEYDKAVGLAENGDPRAALALTELLAQTRDPYLRPHCRYHLGRVFLDGDDPERAAAVLAEYLREDRSRTALDAEVAYFYAHSLAEIPLPDQAARAFAGFLKLFPGAPERYLASAAQQLAELDSQVDSPLHDIADVMKGVERSIRKTDTGEKTQERQKDVMQQLQRIIEEQEEREKSVSGSPSGINPPNAPASSSSAPEGATRIGSLGKVPGVADRWGDLQDRDREAIETDLQTKLPGHYRRMLEEYYKKLNAGRR